MGGAKTKKTKKISNPRAAANNLKTQSKQQQAPLCKILGESNQNQDPKKESQQANKESNPKRKTRSSSQLLE